MALLRIDLFSQCLMRTVPITAIVPVDKARYPEDPVRPEGMPYKTLYLLNGIYGNNLDWVVAGNISMLAQVHNLVIIMPAGENHFYVDCAATGERYGSYVGKELVEQTRRMFPLSHKREDTFIAGLSMGGYGALHTGLLYGETFGYAAGLSAANVPDIFPEKEVESCDYTRTRRYFEAIFGDLSNISDSDYNIAYLYRTRVQSKKLVPKLYMACGTEDQLISANHSLRDSLKEAGADLTYEEGKGIHDFVFWSEYIRHVCAWLPLEQDTEGISSGNVHPTIN
jgi:putative tributyrin esterase